MKALTWSVNNYRRQDSGIVVGGTATVMTIRFGVAGISHWARTIHLPVLKSQPKVRLLGLWGRDSRKAREVADSLEVLAFPSFDELLEKVDAVSIVLPPQVQPDLAVAAARAGKHLMLEKPIALSVGPAESIARAVLDHDVASVVFLLRRFAPIFEERVQTLSKQQWESCRARIHASAFARGSPYAASVWRQAPIAALWDLAPHAMSILIPVLGRVDRIRAAYEGSMLRVNSIHVGGAAAELTLTLRADPAAAVHDYEFNGRAGTASIPDAEFSREEAFATAAAQLIQNIETRTRAHRCNVEFGLEIVRTLQAAEQSVELGVAVEVPKR